MANSPAFSHKVGRAAIALAVMLAAANSAPLSAGESSMVEKAMALVKADRPGDALKLLEKHLAGEPGDNEVRIRYGLILSWEKQLDEARRQLEFVLAASPGNSDALSALINVELWSDHPARAEALAQQALAKRPDDPDFLVKLARAQRAQKRNADAVSAVKRALAVAPDRHDARVLKEGLEEETRMWEAQTSTTQEFFSGGREHWSEWQTSVSRQTGHGSYIARFSQADRFSSRSHMAEIDTYTRLHPGTLLYLNAGYSPDARLYPRTRFGAEVFQSLPGSFEFSTGYRRLNFSSDVNIYTGSVTRYFGNWMFVGRAFITPDTVGTSVTARFGARRYFSTADDFVGVWFSRGASPTEISSITDLTVLHATSYQFELNRHVARRLVLHFKAGFANEERVYNPNLRHYLLDLAAYYRF